MQTRGIRAEKPVKNLPASAGGDVKDGECVYEMDPAVRVVYEAYVLGRYGDFLPILRAQRKHIPSESTNDRIQRCREALGRTERTLTALAPASREGKK
jgi:hypothetical protein